MVRKSSSVPERTCVGCATRRAKEELARFTNKDGSLISDRLALGHSKAGRGAYLCYDKECFLKALKKNAFSRAFKVHVRVMDIDTSEVEGKRSLEAAFEYLWQSGVGTLPKTEKIKEVKLKG